MILINLNLNQIKSNLNQPVVENKAFKTERFAGNKVESQKPKTKGLFWYIPYAKIPYYMEKPF